MKKRLKLLITHPLFAGSTVMIAGSNAINVINYLYHLVLGRLLGPSGYGELASLISLLGLLGIIPLSINLVIIKYTSAAKTKEELTGLTVWLRKKSFQISLVFAVLILVISPFLASFLNINRYPVFLIALSYLFFIPASINRGVLQGLLKFKEMIITTISESAIKFLISIILVVIGLSVGGAMVGYAIAIAVGWLLTEWFLKPFIQSKSGKTPDLKAMAFYTLPVVVQSLATTSLYSSDVVLVKHFFGSYETGLYAALSTLGKIIFFGTGPIGSVMFAVVANRHARGKNYQRIFFYSLLGTAGMAALVLAVYWLRPALAINLLYGSAYLGAKSLLFWFGTFITLFSLSTLVVNFELSIGKVGGSWIMLLAALAQIILIIFNHQNLFNVIFISNTVAALLLIALLIYLWYGKNQSDLGDRSGL